MVRGRLRSCGGGSGRFVERPLAQEAVRHQAVIGIQTPAVAGLAEEADQGVGLAVEGHHGLGLVRGQHLAGTGRDQVAQRDRLALVERVLEGAEPLDVRGRIEAEQARHR